MEFLSPEVVATDFPEINLEDFRAMSFTKEEKKRKMMMMT